MPRMPVVLGMPRFTSAGRDSSLDDVATSLAYCKLYRQRGQRTEPPELLGSIDAINFVIA